MACTQLCSANCLCFAGQFSAVGRGSCGHGFALVATGLSAIPHLSPEKYVALALVLALYVGVLQMIFGQLKLGFLVQLMSKPVMSGFTPPPP